MSAYWYLLPLATPLAYAVYVLVMAGVLRICGVHKVDTARWALRQAGRERFIDLMRAARGHDADRNGERR
jgi:hypothetical protein